MSERLSKSHPASEFPTDVFPGADQLPENRLPIPCLGPHALLLFLVRGPCPDSASCQVSLFHLQAFFEAPIAQTKRQKNATAYLHCDWSIRYSERHYYKSATRRHPPHPFFDLQRPSAHFPKTRQVTQLYLSLFFASVGIDGVSIPTPLLSQGFGKLRTKRERKNQDLVQFTLPVQNGQNLPSPQKKHPPPFC